MLLFLPILLSIACISFSATESNTIESLVTKIQSHHPSFSKQEILDASVGQYCAFSKIRGNKEVQEEITLIGTESSQLRNVNPENRIFKSTEQAIKEESYIVARHNGKLYIITHTTDTQLSTRLANVTIRTLAWFKGC